MQTGSPSKVMQFLVLLANQTLLYAQDTLWARLALAIGRLDTDVLDHARAGLLAFSVVPIHCSLALLAGSCLCWEAARHVPGFPLHTASRAPCKALAGITASSRFPLCTAPAASAQAIPVSSSFSCWEIDVQELLSSELFSLFLNDRLFCSPDHSDSSICTFSRGSRVCQRSNRKLKEFWIHLDITRIQNP